MTEEKIQKQGVLGLILRLFVSDVKFISI